MAEKLRRRAARAIALSLGATATAGATAEAVDRHYVAPYAAVAPFVDGDAADAAWSEAEWRTVQHRWLGPPFSAADFSGRYKAVWTSERIYSLFEFHEDILIAIYADPLQR